MKLALRLFVVSVMSVVAVAQSTERISVDSNENQGSLWSMGGHATPDGRFVLFISTSPELGAAGPDDPFVYLRDRTMGTTTIVSLASSGALPNGLATAGSISADGRVILFSSTATNLGTVNPGYNLFARDLQSGVTTLVNVSSSGVAADQATSFGELSADGRFVAFISHATNLVAGDTNANPDIFVRDLQLGLTERVSVGPGGVEANDASYAPEISADGRYVAYSSRASNLVLGDTNGQFDIFVYDRVTAQTVRANVDSNGAQSSGNADATRPHLSGNGGRVAFKTAASLTPDDTNHLFDVYVRDLQAARTIRVSVASSGRQISEHGGHANGISPDGDFVLFFTRDGSLVPGDTNDRNDVFVHDLSTGQTTRESVATSGLQGNDHSSGGHIVSSRILSFTSDASNLVANDTNGEIDVFFRDRGPQRITPFCAGDGTLVQCPCGNNGTARRGCATPFLPHGPTGPKGAYLGGYGYPLVSADSLVLQVEQVTGYATLFYQGDAQQPPAILDDGISCVAGNILRVGTKPNVSNTALYPSVGDAPISVRGLIPAGGGTRYYQALYRSGDPAFCPPATTNRTNGLIVAWGP